jgi:(p)ppGpp synthase/HD superfamily hydrolase
MPVLLDLTDAVSFIKQQHSSNSKTPDNRYRKNPIGGTKLTYFFHPIEVSKLIWTWGAGTQVAMLGALGHDLYEDTNVTEEEVLRVLGSDADIIIKELTHDEKE